MNELVINENFVEVVKGKVNFLQYDKLKFEALQLSSWIKTIEVNEENIQFTKKLVASAQKAIKELESRRISIKNDLLDPYNQFEKQVKEIVGIVNEADAVVREQIKELEEREREEKEQKIKEIFDLRILGYEELKEYINFNMFIDPRFLNKTVTIKKIEEELTAWLEIRQKDVETIKLMPDSTALLAEYFESLDLATAIKVVRERAEKQQRIRESVQNVSCGESYYFVVHDEKDAKLTEMFLKENKIKYERENAKWNC